MKEKEEERSRSRDTPEICPPRLFSFRFNFSLPETQIFAGTFILDEAGARRNERKREVSRSGEERKRERKRTSCAGVSRSFIRAAIRLISSPRMRLRARADALNRIKTTHHRGWPTSWFHALRTKLNVRRSVSGRKRDTRATEDRK